MVNAIGWVVAAGINMAVLYGTFDAGKTEARCSTQLCNGSPGHWDVPGSCLHE